MAGVQMGERPIRTRLAFMVRLDRAGSNKSTTISSTVNHDWQCETPHAVKMNGQLRNGFEAREYLEYCSISTMVLLNAKCCDRADQAECLFTVR